MPDIIAAPSLDNAVMTFGVWCENRLAEIDRSTGNPRYTLEQLLDDTPRSAGERNRDSFLALQMMTAMMRGRNRSLN